MDRSDDVIIMLAAVDEHGVIGSQGVMPWYNAEDLAWFKERTLHHHLLMGRVTWEHLPKTLDQRILHIASRREIKENEYTIWCYDMNTLLSKYQNTNKELIICGGADIYRQSLPYTDEIWLSRIPGIYQGDAYFPDISAFICIEKIKKKTFVLEHYIRPSHKEETTCAL